MNTFIKITPFNAASSDHSESVDEYLDDVQTAALCWDLAINPPISEPTHRSKIRFFRQHLGKNGDAYNWWYYLLPESDKKHYGKIVEEFRERYGIKATQASSLFAVQNEMLSLLQGEGERIRDYMHRVEKLSCKIPKEMDSLFAIAFVKSMRDQERKQRVTFDLKDSPNFSFLKALTVVKFSFQEIGEPYPFRPNQTSPDSPQVNVSLYSPSSVSQVNAVSKTDITHSAQETIPLAPLFMQEQFNPFMSSYEASMGRMPRQPFSSSNGANNRRGNPRVTCFNCGARGHYSDTCTNQPLTAHEQQGIRDRIRQERDSQQQQDYQTSPVSQLPSLSGANATELTPRTILQRGLHDSSNPVATVSSPVSCLRSCPVSRRDLGNACVVAARIPAVRTIFENALVEKRARVDEGDSESVSGQRGPKVVQRLAEPGESSRLRRSLRSTNSPLAHQKGPEISGVAEKDGEEENTYMVSPPEDIMGVIDDLEEIQPPVAGRFQPVVAQPRRLKAKMETVPINWIKGEAPLTIRDALNGPENRLQIRLPQLLDCSPRLRRDLAELLRSSVPQVRKKQAIAKTQSTEPVSLHSAKLAIRNEVVSEASPEPEDNIECLYIEAWVGNIKVLEVLVDAGAMLDLISSQLVDTLRLQRFPVSSLGMRLADDRLVVLKN